MTSVLPATHINKTQSPLVSVVVPNLNRGRFLERCLKSILNQTYCSLECIVVDGGSKDESLQVLDRMANEDPRLRYVSEPDEGEVYAVNKGIEMSKGHILAFQATDDYYVPDAVDTSVKYLVHNPKYIGASGDARFVDENGASLNRGMITYRRGLRRDNIRSILIVRYKTSPLNHGAFFGWRERLLRYGYLNPAFSVIPDVEFYLRLLEAGEEIAFLPRIQVNYTLHEDMGAVKYRQKVNQQLKLIYRRHGLRWHHHVMRLTIGRAISYLENPYRSNFIPGVLRETKAAFNNMMNMFPFLRIKRDSGKPKSK